MMKREQAKPSGAWRTNRKQNAQKRLGTQKRNQPILGLKQMLEMESLSLPQLILIPVSTSHPNAEQIMTIAKLMSYSVNESINQQKFQYNRNHLQIHIIIIQIILAMGNKQNNNSKEIDLKINHPTLSKAKLCSDNGEQLLRLFVGLDEAEYEKWSIGVRKYKGNDSHLLLPIRHGFQRAGLCGNSGSVEIYFPNYSYLLQDEIESRRARKDSFKEEEMWYSLYSLVKAKRQAMAAGQLLGDVRPRNVMINEKGFVKVPSLDSWPNNLGKYQKSLDKIVTYLSPQQLKLLQLGDLDGSKVAQTSQIFSIGLTLLSIGNLQDYQQIYILKNYSFDHDKLSDALQLWIQNQNYSLILRATILNICSADPTKRMTAEQLWNLLHRHQPKINKKIGFVIDNAPLRLHETVLLINTVLAELSAQKAVNMQQPKTQSYVLYGQPQIQSQFLKQGDRSVFPQKRY